MSQRLHQSAATSLRLVAMARSRIGERPIVTGRCSNVRGTDEQHRRAMRPLDHVLGQQRRTFLADVLVRTTGSDSPQPSGARCLSRRPAHAWAATGVHLYWPLNQQLTLRPQMRAEHAGKRHSRYFAPGQTDQFAPEQSRVGPKPDGLGMNRHRASGYYFSVISAQTLRVCREGKSLYTSCFGFCLPLAWSRQATGDIPESLFSTWVANKVPTACAVHASGVSPEEIRQPVT